MVAPINQVALLAFVALGKWGILPILETGNDDDMLMMMIMIKMMLV